MALIITPSAALMNTYSYYNQRTYPFDQSFTASFDPAEEYESNSTTYPHGQNSLIVSTTISRVTLPTTDPGVTLVSGTTTCRMYGTYAYGFLDDATYVHEGQSDLTETPTTVVGLENVPVGQNLYIVHSDTNTREFVYNITVSYFAGSYTGRSTTLTDQVFTFTHYVWPEFSGPRLMVDKYFPFTNAGGFIQDRQYKILSLGNTDWDIISRAATRSWGNGTPAVNGTFIATLPAGTETVHAGSYEINAGYQITSVGTAPDLDTLKAIWNAAAGSTGKWQTDNGGNGVPSVGDRFVAQTAGTGDGIVKPTKTVGSGTGTALKVSFT